MTDRIAFVGTGPDPEHPDSDGFAMAYRHARGYRRVEDTTFVGCADIVPANAAAFAERHGIDDDGVFEDYERMLDAVDPDVVSVCVPPDAHAEIVVGCAETGVPDVIHCEKPMATTWGDCLRMAEACAEANVRLSINHQQRLGPVFRAAKSLLDDGVIGSLRRIEWSQKNLFDSGTHTFALASYYADDRPVEWVLCGLDYREENRWFGTHNENQAVAQWQYADGVTGLAVTGAGEHTVDPYLALSGSDGRIELGASDAPPLRYRASDTDGWRTVDAGENVWGDYQPSTLRAGLSLVARHAPLVPDDLFSPDYPGHVDRAIAHVLESYRSDRPCELRAGLALRSTELVFAAYESVRSRGRVDLPLTVENNPLESMVEDGLLEVTAAT